MALEALTERSFSDAEKKAAKKFQCYRSLIDELRTKELSPDVVETVNKEIAGINAHAEHDRGFIKKIRKSQYKILRLVEKQLKLVAKNHYRNMWLALGMTTFGLPLGIVYGLAMDNLGLLGLGLPIGMVIGMAIGSNMDKKAKEEGRQLDVEISI